MATAAAMTNARTGRDGRDCAVGPRAASKRVFSAWFLLCLLAGALALFGSKTTTGTLPAEFRAAAAGYPHTGDNAAGLTKPIEEIEPGDWVLARSEFGDEVAPRRVVRTFQNVSDHLRVLTIRGSDGTTQELRTTDGHPFWVEPTGWTLASELQPGDKLSEPDGGQAILLTSLYEPHPDGVAIFNFEVEGEHTYYVTAPTARGPPVLVHNASRGGSGRTRSTGVRQVGGRNPINSKYAGKTHPSGVRFTKEGFPDFSPYAKAQVEVKGLTGKYDIDEAMANCAVGLKRTPDNFVWHHVEDGVAMQLISKLIHRKVRHTGGSAVIRHRGK